MEVALNNEVVDEQNAKSVQQSIAPPSPPRPIPLNPIQLAHRRRKANLEVKSLDSTTVSQLQRKYYQVFREPTRNRNKAALKKKIAAQILYRAEGGLLGKLFPVDESSPEGAEATSVQFWDPRLPPPGCTLTRNFQGKDYVVRILEDGGFELDGQRFEKLSHVANHIAGGHWNGFLFFKQALDEYQRKSRGEQ